MTYTVTAADLGQICLNETDHVRSVLQNIALLLATRQGTCPMYRGFGLPQRFMDKPTTVARTILYSEVKEALEIYEPRARLVRLEVEEDLSAPGKLIPTVEVDIQDAELGV